MSVDSKRCTMSLNSRGVFRPECGSDVRHERIDESVRQCGSCYQLGHREELRCESIASVVRFVMSCTGLNAPASGNRTGDNKYLSSELNPGNVTILTRTLFRRDARRVDLDVSAFPRRSRFL